MQSKKICYLKRTLYFMIPASFTFISWNTDMNRVVWNGSGPLNCTDRSCVAVGGYNMAGVLLESRQPFTMYSNDLGKTFGKGVEAPLPTKEDRADGAQLTGVNCVKNHCVAVGAFGLKADLFNSPQTMSGKPLAMTSDDGGLTFTQAYQPPLPDGADTNLLSHIGGVTCNDDNCVGVGQYNFDIATNNGVGLAYVVVSHDGGRTFSSAFEPTLPNNQNVSRDARLLNVSCAGNNCVGVGRYTTQDNAVLPLAVFSDDGGETFTVASSPQLPNDFSQNEKFASLVSVSCNTAQRCVAVGSYAKYLFDSNPHTPFVAISYDGGRTFTHQYEMNLPADAISGTHAQVTSISCSGTGNCTAVGTYNVEVDFNSSMGITGGVPFVATSTDGGETFVASSSINAPNPTDETQTTQLTGVSCNYFCVAVGGYNMTIEYTNVKSGSVFSVFNKKAGDDFSHLFIPELPVDSDPLEGSIFGYGNIGL